MLIMLKRWFTVSAGTSSMASPEINARKVWRYMLKCL